MDASALSPVGDALAPHQGDVRGGPSMGSKRSSVPAEFYKGVSDFAPPRLSGVLVSLPGIRSGMSAQIDRLGAGVRDVAR